MFHAAAKLFQRFLDTIENSKVSRAIRKGLITAIPVLMIGSIALILLSLPVDTYQAFLAAFGGGVLGRVLEPRAQRCV